VSEFEEEKEVENESPRIKKGVKRRISDILAELEQNT